MARHFPAFSPVAEHGLLVEFGDSIARAVHGEVVALDRALAARPFPGFEEAVPAYASLLVRFDPLLCDHAAAEVHVRALLGEGAPEAGPTTLHEVPVCYDSDLAPDLDAVAAATGLSREAVIAAHLAGDYRVFMYGFAPGYAYLAEVPEAIRLPRKPAAVRGVPAGSVLIAGPQCLVSALTMPTGWWIIGRSPAAILVPEAERPFLFGVGDSVRFTRIDRDTFERATRA
jgi:inhibitor of KinA